MNCSLPFPYSVTSRYLEGVYLWKRVAAAKAITTHGARVKRLAALLSELQQAA